MILHDTLRAMSLFVEHAFSHTFFFQDMHGFCSIGLFCSWGCTVKKRAGDKRSEGKGLEFKLEDTESWRKLERDMVASAGDVEGRAGGGDDGERRQGRDAHAWWKRANWMGFEDQ